jgi:hypothetical protein
MDHFQISANLIYLTAVPNQHHLCELTCQSRTVQEFRTYTAQPQGNLGMVLNRFFLNA